MSRSVSNILFRDPRVSYVLAVPNVLAALDDVQLNELKAIVDKLANSIRGR